MTRCQEINTTLHWSSWPLLGC